MNDWLIDWFFRSLSINVLISLKVSDCQIFAEVKSKSQPNKVKAKTVELKPVDLAKMRCEPVQPENEAIHACIESHPLWVLFTFLLSDQVIQFSQIYLEKNSMSYHLSDRVMNCCGNFVSLL